MNRAKQLQNHKEGGNNYVLKAKSINKWCGFYETIITKLINSFGNDFNIVIWSDEQKKNDFYIIPFTIVKHLFTDEFKKTKSMNGKGWQVHIRNNKFMIEGKSEFSVDVSNYYAEPYPI